MTEERGPQRWSGRRWDGQRRWGGQRGWGGQRPPWWPEGESWPPQGPEAWRTVRHRFMRRMARYALTALIVLGLIAGLVIWAISRLLGASPGSTIAGVIVLLVLLAVARGLVRGLRGSAAPIADMMAAASRVETGDYAARVNESGPPDVRRLARAFNAMSARLERDADERRQLLADVSHELRTPLSVIQGDVEGILDGLYPADRAHLEPILEEIGLLERLVDDLRTLSLAETGGLRLHREPTDLHRLLADVAAAFEARAQAAGLSLRVDAPADLPMLDLDVTRMRQVLGNLVANALRFTPRGGDVTIAAATAGEATTIEVRDTGTGIDPEILPHVFDRFYRAADSTGSGLGLPIARSLVEAHGGTIEATPGQPRGTTVRISLPTRNPASTP